MLLTFTRVCLSAIVLACAAAAQAQTPTATARSAARPPIASFFDDSSFSSAKLSPNGKYLAVKFTPAGKRDGLFVIDLATNQGTPVANFSDMDVDRIEWVNSERLLLNTRDKQLGRRDVKWAPGLFAVNRDGKELRQLVDLGSSAFNTGSRTIKDQNRLPRNTFMLDQPGSQDSDYVYVTSNVQIRDTLRHVDLLRLNTLTGRSHVVKRPPDARHWLLDNAGQPRVVVTEKDNTSNVFMLDKASDEWRLLSTGKVFANQDNAFEPLGFAPDGTLYVRTNNGSNDTTAVHAFNAATGQVSAEPVIKTPGYDFDGALISTSDKVVGMRFTTDAESTIWFDDKYKALQKRIDDLLPATVNLVSIARRSETPWVLVETYSDRQPRSFLLFNADSGAFRKVGDEHPAIDPAQMARQQQVSYTARDGLAIPALLTLPAGKSKDLPLVVLIHGGPWVRGSTWGWERESQFLASRGYAVLEPSFRGTTGLGNKHYKASFKQWGLSMQDDIADGAAWAVAKGIADPRRMCLAGASYGGYATLMGLIKNPELFKCGVNWVGVTDLELHFKGDWTFKSDMQDNWRDFGGPEMVGDLVKDAAQIRATSPLVHAAKITQPLLLAYGGADPRVPRYQGEKFYKAIKETNQNVEWIMYEEEGHGWALPKNSIDFWGRVEQFLDKHIGSK